MLICLKLTFFVFTGYGNVAPKTPWGKIVTIFYAIVGIPLLLLCLSNIGDAMAHSFKFLYWKVCCYFCIRPKKHRKRTANRILTAPYRTQITRQATLPPPLSSTAADAPDSPNPASSSTYHTAQTSASPTISSCKSTPKHDVHQMMPFTPVVFPQMPDHLSSPYTIRTPHDMRYHHPQDVSLGPVITNKYALQEDIKVDTRPLQLRKKEGTVIGTDIFSIMNTRNHENFAFGNRQMFPINDE